MAIEKMSFAHISGPVSALDRVLLDVLVSGVFQPEYTSKLSEYSVGTPIPAQNPYADLLARVRELAGSLQISLESIDSPLPRVDDRKQYLAGRQRELDELEEAYKTLDGELSRSKNRIAACETALGLLARLDKADLDFNELSRASFLHIRFGRMPEEQLPLMDAMDAPFTLQTMQREDGYMWCVYITPKENACQVDRLFESAGFESVEVPESTQQGSAEARTFIARTLESARDDAKSSAQRLEQMSVRGRESLRVLYSELVYLHDAFDLRRYAVNLRGVFHLVGYLLSSDADTLTKAAASENERIEIHILPCQDDIPNLQTPVKLKNSRFARPFEMFVEMYGSPGYRGIDPTPFVAWTYSLLFGMMFGDVGQGLCITLLGWLLHRFRNMSLGPIMMRIGVVSSLFGVVYGSVFGYEHLLDGFYQKVFGLAHKPVEIFEPATTNIILLSAVAIGVVTIVTVMILNVAVGIKQKDTARIFLSSNGLPGIIFFVAVVAAVLAALTGSPIHTLPYILCLIVLPILVIFFKEPIERLMHFYSADSIILSSHNLVDSMRFHKLDEEIHALFSAKYISARFGRLPTWSFEKLRFYSEDPFILHPIKSDRDYIWCVYTMAASDKESVDAIFHDLYFERIYIPKDLLETSEQTESFIRRCIDSEQAYRQPAPGEAPTRKRTILRRMFPDGIGGFIVESFFEMFEVVLSFVTNTMSFLRVGGFILSHAGMMSVVMALSEMAGAGASPIVMVVGNLFVMALEGLIVGIQVLRLEFYEIFSRFYDGGGEPFRPVCVKQP